MILLIYNTLKRFNSVTRVSGDDLRIEKATGLLIECYPCELGKKDIFYNIAGGDVRAIDGSTEYSVYPSNVSTKLPPKDPSRVAAQLSAAVRQSGLLTKKQLENFTGSLVMDANDLGCNLLGSDAPLAPETYEAMFKDNPKG